MSDFNFDVRYQGVQAQFGQKGHEWVGTGETTTSGKWYVAIQAAEDSVVTYTDKQTETTFTSKSIPAGLVIVGKLEDLTVTSGNVIAYFSKKL